MPAAAPPPSRGVLWLPAPAARRLGVASVELVWSPLGLRALRFLGQRGPDDPRGLEPVPEPYASTLAAYFDGAPLDPAALPADLDGTPFLVRVWAALRAIPRGEVRSYRDVAQAVGAPRATRAVGVANARNPLPLVVPCHRVVAADRTLGGFSAGGPDRKRRLLELEGVAIDGERVHPRQLLLAP